MTHHPADHERAAADLQRWQEDGTVHRLSLRRNLPLTGATDRYWPPGMFDLAVRSNLKAYRELRGAPLEAVKRSLVNLRGMVLEHAPEIASQREREAVAEHGEMFEGVSG